MNLEFSDAGLGGTQVSLHNLQGMMIETVSSYISTDKLQCPVAAHLNGKD